MKRSLNLRTERLAELTPAELDSVAAGAMETYDTCLQRCIALVKKAVNDAGTDPTSTYICV